MEGHEGGEQKRGVRASGSPLEIDGHLNQGLVVMTAVRCGVVSSRRVPDRRTLRGAQQ